MGRVREGGGGCGHDVLVLANSRALHTIWHSFKQLFEQKPGVLFPVQYRLGAVVASGDGDTFDDDDNVADLDNAVFVAIADGEIRLVVERSEDQVALFLIDEEVDKDDNADLVDNKLDVMTAD